MRVLDAVMRGECSADLVLKMHPLSCFCLPKGVRFEFCSASHLSGRRVGGVAELNNSATTRASSCRRVSNPVN